MFILCLPFRVLLVPFENQIFHTQVKYKTSSNHSNNIVVLDSAIFKNTHGAKQLIFRQFLSQNSGYSNLQKFLPLSPKNLSNHKIPQIYVLHNNLIGEPMIDLSS